MSRLKNADHEEIGTPLFGLAAAGSFSISAVFIRAGLATGVSPVAGLWIGFLLALAVYLPFFLIRRRSFPTSNISNSTYLVQVLAGLAITLGMWSRYLAMQSVPVGVVTALGRINIPLILLLSPIFYKSRIDATSPRLWIGSLLIIGGTTVIIYS